eukprot:71055-Rhodomonas_salina.2
MSQRDHCWVDVTDESDAALFSPCPAIQSNLPLLFFNFVHTKDFGGYNAKFNATVFWVFATGCGNLVSV